MNRCSTPIKSIQVTIIWNLLSTWFTDKNSAKGLEDSWKVWHKFDSEDGDSSTDWNEFNSGIKSTFKVGLMDSKGYGISRTKSR